MLRLISAVSFLMATSAIAAAQSEVRQPGPFTFSVAVGPTRAFRGVDAPGVQGTGGIARSLAQGFGVRLDGTAQWYDAQPLYPCIIQDASGCYQTIRRAVGAGILSATYHMSRFREDKGNTIPYVISGLGVYRSRRIATRYSDCEPTGPCDRSMHRLELRDTQLGWSGGAGFDAQLGSVRVFAETRLHYVYNDRPGAELSNDYFVWPLSLGFRF